MSTKLLSNKKGIFLIIILTAGFLSSCRKDKLKDDKEIFIGKWSWGYTSHDYGWCDNESYFEILTPQTENTTFSIEFFKKGKLEFYKNGSFVDQYRIKFVQFEINDYCELKNAFKFNIDLDNIGDNDFNGCLNSDTLLLGSFPDFIFQTEQGCENYVNYFIKE